MLSNYGIKRMLPRLIAAAILVNVSYYICLIAIDVSNILGASVYDLFNAVPVTVADDASGTVSGGNGVPGGWSKAIAGVLIAGAIGVGLVLALSTGIAGLIALVMIVLILIARQALIVLLVVVSPLAFVAFLLPNTEDWFKKWWKIFWTLLLVFPVIGLIFGASNLAAKILGNTGETWLTFMALGVSVIPLFAVPVVLKGALGAAGSIGQKLQGIADSRSKAAGDRRREFTQRQTNRARAGVLGVRGGEGKLLGGKTSLRRRGAGWLADRTVGAGVTRDQKNKYAEIGKDAAERSYFANRAVNEAGYAEKVAGGSEEMATLVRGYAQQAVREEDAKDIKAERSLMEYTPVSELHNTMRTSTGAKAAAAAAEIASRGSGEDVQAALDAIKDIDKSKDDGKTSRMVQQQLIGNMGSDQFGLGQGDKSALTSGDYDGVSYDQKINGRAEKKMSGETLAGLQPHDTKKLGELAAAGQLSDKALQNIVNSVQEARSNPNVNAKIKVEAKEIHDTIIAQAAAKGITATPAQAAAAPPSQPVAPQTTTAPGGGTFTQSDSGLYIPRE